LDNSGSKSTGVDKIKLSADWDDFLIPLSKWALNYSFPAHAEKEIRLLTSLIFKGLSIKSSKINCFAKAVLSIICELKLIESVKPVLILISKMPC
jgi:hypothetical protein